jgi:hypothetical protein
MTTHFRKFMFGAMIAALVIAILPMTSVLAARVIETATPPAPGITRQTERQNTRLELAFARQQYNLQRASLNIGNATAFFEQVQALLDKAKEDGKDASAVQAAFNTYKAAFEKNKVLFEQAKTISATHAGFDAIGQVSDTEKAKASVENLNEALKQYHESMTEPFKTLREAIQTFRKANPRPSTTPTAP